MLVSGLVLCRPCTKLVVSLHCPSSVPLSIHGVVNGVCSSALLSFCWVQSSRERPSRMQVLDSSWVADSYSVSLPYYAINIMSDPSRRFRCIHRLRCRTHLRRRDVSPCIQREGDCLLQHFLVHRKHHRSRCCQRRSRSQRKLVLALAHLASMLVSRNYLSPCLVYSRVASMALRQQQARFSPGNSHQMAWTR
jgi:hypothetical protein